MSTANNLEKDFCLACNEIVDYEIDGDNKHCSVCGRTKGAAEIFLKNMESENFSRKKKKIFLYAFILIGLLSALILFIFSPERFDKAITNATSKILAFTILLSIFFILYYFYKKIIHKFK